MYNLGDKVWTNINGIPSLITITKLEYKSGTSIVIINSEYREDLCYEIKNGIQYLDE